jgi:hypothetical protein
MNNPNSQTDKMSSAGLLLVKIYIATALLVWKVIGFLIAGAEGFSSAFSASPMSLAIGGGYVLAVGILLAHAFLQFKRRQYQGITGTLVFAGLGMLFLMLGADLSFDSVSFIGSLIGLGMIGLTAYYSWKGMRYFKSRAFLYWFWGYLITLAAEIGMRFGYAAGPLPPGAVEHAGWFWNLVQNAGLSSLHAEWFLELYWLGQIVAGVLIAAGMILLVRQSGPEGSQPLSVNTARYVALGVLFMLLGIYPSLAFFESPGFVTTCVVNAVMLWYALSACRRPNGTCFALWAWAAGVTLLLTVSSLFHRAWEYPPRGSDLMILKLTVMGGLVAGFLRVSGLMVALRQPPAAKLPDEPKSETVSKVIKGSVNGIVIF